MKTILSFIPVPVARRATYIYLALMAGAALFGGCSDEGDMTDKEVDRIPVSFSAGIQTVNTRTVPSGDTWLPTDRIGIIMAATGSNINFGDGILADNFSYTAVAVDIDGNGNSIATFTATDGKPIYYPAKGRVDFYAYYPYTKKETDGGKLSNYYEYPVDLSNQSNPSTIDVLYALVKDMARSTSPVNLRFCHVLSKITLNITAGDGINADDISALKAINVEINIETRARLAIWNDSRIFSNGNTKSVNPYRENTTSAGATFSAIVLPGNHNAIPVTFILKGKKYMCTLPAGQWYAGTNYIYPVTIRGAGITVGTSDIKSWEQENKRDAPTERFDMVYLPADTLMMGSSNGTNIGNADGSGLNPPADLLPHNRIPPGDQRVVWIEKKQKIRD